MLSDTNVQPTPKVPLVFMGTPDFSATILKHMIEDGFHIVGVVTRQDKPSGRNQIMTASPVKQVAEVSNIPVLQPEKLDTDAIGEIARWKPDLIVVAAYGKILPEKLLHLPGLGCINVHASLLPKWRGASPIQNALMAGDQVTGITLMLMDAGVDTGDIIAQKSLPIEPGEMSDSLTERLSLLGSQLLSETLPEWIKRRITPQPQNSDEATLCQLIEREDGRVFWNASADDIYNRYRGLSPWPGLFTFWKKNEDLNRIKLKRISIQKTDPLRETPVGTVLELGEKIGIQTGSGIIFLDEVQQEGKEVIPIRDFLNGNPDFLGTILM